MTGPVSTILPVTPPSPESRKIADAARQFEALLIGHMFRSVRESGLDDEDDSSNTTMLEVADQQFSQMLANSGGLGLARLIVQGLKPSD
jgi:Rod binding domain-containing protein